MMSAAVTDSGASDRDSRKRFVLPRMPDADVPVPVEHASRCARMRLPATRSSIKSAGGACASSRIWRQEREHAERQEFAAIHHAIRPAKAGRYELRRFQERPIGRARRCLCTATIASRFSGP